MSDLAATNCGNGCGCGNDSCSIIWIILILSCLGGCNGGLFGRSGSDCDGNNSCIWIILLLLFCGNGSGFSLSNNGSCGGFGGCGCGC